MNQLFQTAERVICTSKLKVFKKEIHLIFTRLIWKRNKESLKTMFKSGNDQSKYMCRDRVCVGYVLVPFSLHFLISPTLSYFIALSDEDHDNSKAKFPQVIKISS